MERVEPQIGDWVLVDLPRSRWDHRQGILREIRLMRSLAHPGVLGLHDLIMPPSLDHFDDVYSNPISCHFSSPFQHDTLLQW